MLTKFGADGVEDVLNRICAIVRPVHHEVEVVGIFDDRVFPVRPAIVEAWLSLECAELPFDLVTEIAERLRLGRREDLSLEESVEVGLVAHCRVVRIAANWPFRLAASS